jgi:PTS system fructose-specific IIC component
MRWLNAKIQLGPNLNGLKPVLILPVLGAFIVGLIMIFVVGKPVAFLLSALTHWLTTMQSTNAFLIGLLLGAMMAFDMGGPINKSAYTFAVGLLASHIYTPMAAVMAAGMTPPLGLALASWLFRNRFDKQDQQAAGPAFVLGLSFITEGAIPYAGKDPFRVIPSCMLGSAVAGAISLGGHVGLVVPHGGVFVLAIPGAATNLVLYFIAIAAGALVTAGALYVLKRPIATETPAPARQEQWAEPAGAVRA